MKSYPYDFGICQEDERTEAEALELGSADRVLCIASAGEMPLSLLALGAGRVVAVDVAPGQIELVRLKLAAACALEREQALRFLGYLPLEPAQRLELLPCVLRELGPASRSFWRSQPEIVARGAIWAGRFERYLGRLRPLLWMLAGRKPIEAMCSARSREEQRTHFLRAFGRPRVRWLFRVAFHPWLFGGLGMDRRSLRHRNRDESLGEQYYARLEQLCTSTPARDNHLLQLMMLGRLAHPDAAPAYLSRAGIEVVRQRSAALRLVQADLLSFLSAEIANRRDRCEPGGPFDKAHLSNLADWLDEVTFVRLLDLLVRTMTPSGRIVWRALHARRGVPRFLSPRLQIEADRGDRLRQADRFPFYRITPARLLAA